MAMSEKKVKPVGPYSRSRRTSELVFVSGQLGIDPETGALVDGVENQATFSLKNVAAVLEEDGLTLANVVKATVLLANIDDFQAVNAVYATFFEEPYPARSAFAVRDLPLGALVEIEVIAEKTH
ncbi:Rid family detoxifying hydrolase [uncultured Enterococcus sp.]|uniref:Rid family detoxifying hydrolase n=1 Tax=uncultured Enterococcus sp. TaxID=167972 RepID=UPI002597D78A|nr:Rid family detoxifying hydrolase [uncultured Enterococcus sp.]